MWQAARGMTCVCVCRQPVRGKKRKIILYENVQCLWFYGCTLEYVCDTFMFGLKTKEKPPATTRDSHRIFKAFASSNIWWVQSCSVCFITNAFSVYCVVSFCFIFAFKNFQHSLIRILWKFFFRPSWTWTILFSPPNEKRLWRRKIEQNNAYYNNYVLNMLRRKRTGK